MSCLASYQGVPYVDDQVTVVDLDICTAAVVAHSDAVGIHASARTMAIASYITDQNPLCKRVETTSRAVGIRKAGRYPTPFGGIDVKQQSLKNSTQLSKKLDFEYHVLKVKADESCQ